MNDSLNLDFLDGWEWLGQILLLVALALIAAVVARQFFNFLERQTTRTSSVWDDALPEAARRPFFVALWLQVAVAALQFAAQALLNGLLADEVFATTRALIIIHGFAWFLVRLNTGIERRMLERFHADPAAEADSGSDSGCAAIPPRARPGCIWISRSWGPWPLRSSATPQDSHPVCRKFSG